MAWQKKSLTTKVFDNLRERIVSLEYPPGMPLSDKELCQQYGVSRTPLREALRKLENMGLVTILPRYGTQVSIIDITAIRCAYEVRIKLEGLAGATAARRISEDKLDELQNIVKELTALSNSSDHDQQPLMMLDARFHEIVYEASENHILCTFLENIYSRCARAWNASLGETDPLTENIEQLKELYLALKRRDTAESARLCEEHVQSFIIKLRKYLL